MAESWSSRKVLIVDDEWESPIVKSVRRRLEDEGWQTLAVEPGTRSQTGDEFEAAALYAIEEERPEAVLLDVRFGEHADDRFKGLGILGKIVERYPTQPVLTFTQYAQGPERETAVGSALKWDAPVDFIDKLASPEEVVLTLNRRCSATRASRFVASRYWWAMRFWGSAEIPPKGLPAISITGSASPGACRSMASATTCRGGMA
jgi:CheY-like chemotaxis protein